MLLCTAQTQRMQSLMGTLARTDLTADLGHLQHLGRSSL